MLLPGSSIRWYADPPLWSSKASALNGCMKALQMGALQEATVGGSGGGRRRGPPPARPSPAPPGCLHRSGRPQRTDRAAARPGSQDIAAWGPAACWALASGLNHHAWPCPGLLRVAVGAESKWRALPQLRGPRCVPPQRLRSGIARSRPSQPAGPIPIAPWPLRGAAGLPRGACKPSRAPAARG